MINYYSDNDFTLENDSEITKWLLKVVHSKNCTLGELSFIFCDDKFLLDINVEFLDHDTLTDIISFDYSLGTELHGEIYISTERILENSELLDTGFKNELYRVLVHGVLHLCGYNDKSDEEAALMRELENKALLLLYV